MTAAVSKRLFLGIDVSTTGAKAILLEESGATVVASATTPLDLQTPRPLWSEQDPEAWWQGVVASVRQVIEEVDATRVVAVGLTGQMHGLTLLDAAGEVLRPAILWNDQRTGEECDEIRRSVGRERLIQITGNDALTGFTLPKLMWVRQHEPEIYSRVRHVLLPKDYVRYRLSGEFATDRAGASGTLLLDLERRDWSFELLEALDLDAALLPKTYEGTEVTGVVTQQAAQLTGLPEGIPIVAGAGDQAAQGVGVGALEPGVCAVTLGTSGVVFATTDGPRVEKEGRLHAFCHALPECWHLMGVMLSAAGSLRWYRDALYPELSYDALTAEAAAIAPGANGLCFLPYLTGERTPHADPLARGAFVGLTLQHGRAHMTRALLEGVAFGLRQCFELMRGAGLGGQVTMRVSGGGARSDLWCQILADTLNVPLQRVAESEGAALGAALLARLAVLGRSAREVSSAIAVEATFEPQPKAASVYEEAFAIYEELYPALAACFTSLSESQQ